MLKVLNSTPQKGKDKWIVKIYKPPCLFCKPKRENNMKIIDHIKRADGNPLFSFELLPPAKGQGIQSIFNTMDELMEFKPPFIDVTYHREDYLYKQHSNGLLERVAYRKRPGTVAICAAIMNKYKVDAVPHLICGGFTKEETENALIDLHYLGVDNVLALRGDSPSNEKFFSPHPKGHRYALELVNQIVQLNQGKYLEDDIVDAGKTDFCIGVAGYPETHFEAANKDLDLQFMKQKIDAGADYVTTQMFFDNARYFSFVEQCREADIHVPVIPGLKPVTSKRQLSVLPSIF